MAVSLTEFVQQVIESTLLSDADISAAMASVPNQRQPVDGEQLARLLVKLKKLTAFQAQQLYAGKGKALTLGNYVILDKLGQGGMGMVLKAEHRRMKRVVALKVLSPAVTKNDDMKRRFQREVEAAAKLEHPHIVTAYDADEGNGTHFLVMQYVEGSDLAALVKAEGPLPVERAVSCILQAARGLEYAHEQGVIHRDIKPANLLLDQKGVVKILDMGLARIDNSVGGSAEGAGLTNTGTIMGTVDYMSPEQAMDTKHADARSDIYSLGMSLFYLLTGRVAYDGDTMMKKLMAHQNAPIPSLSAFRSQIALDSTGAGQADLQLLQQVFQRMVAKRPEDRPQTMTQVIAELQHCVGGSAPTIQFAGGSGTSTAPSSGTNAELQRFLQQLNGEAVASGTNLAVTGSKGTAVSQDDSQGETLISSAGLTGAESNTEPSVNLRPSERQALKQVAGKASAGLMLKSRKGVLTAMAGGVVLLLCVAIWVATRPPAKTQVAKRDGGQNKKSLPVRPSETGNSTDANQVKTDSTRGASSSALDFDGLDDYVDLPSLNCDTGKPFTLEGWITPNSATAHSHILVLHGEITAAIQQNDNAWHGLRLSRGSLGMVGDPGVYPTAGQTRHVALVWDGTQQRLFVDGKGHSQETTGQANHCSTSGAVLGCVRLIESVPMLRYHFSGRIDEVRVSLVARYNQDFNPPSPDDRFTSDQDTLALYHFDEGGGTQLTDSSGNNHHGKIVGAKWVRESPIDFQSPTPDLKSAPPSAVAPFSAQQAIAYQAAWAKHLGTTVEQTNSIGAKLILIPPGEFLMGSTDAQVAAALKMADEFHIPASDKERLEANERPQHRVEIRQPFRMSTTEVTNGEFRQFVEAKMYRTEAEVQGFGDGSARHDPAKLTAAQKQKNWRSTGLPLIDQYPVIQVTWNDAVAFCQWLSEKENAEYRLPTEAEWEYACRAGTETQFSFGDDASRLNEYCWYKLNSGHAWHPVATRLPNAFGLFDMHGNQAEWCQDLFDAQLYTRPLTPMPESVSDDPPRSIRGGHWYYDVPYQRSASRQSSPASLRFSSLGFRYVRVLDVPEATKTGVPRPDREVAEWVLDREGHVILVNSDTWVDDKSGLPDGDFKLKSVKFKKPLPDTDVDLVPLRKLNLVYVGLDNSSASAAAIAGLQSMSNLENISCGSLKLDDERFAALLSLKQLKGVWLASAAVTPAQCAVLARELRQVRSLNLMNNRLLDDSVVQPLSGMTQLQSLQLQGTKLTVQGIAELRKALPNCSIEWEQPLNKGTSPR